MEKSFRAEGKANHLLVAIVLDQEKTHDLRGVLWV